MVFKTKRKNQDQAFEMKINDQQIDKVNNTNFLGSHIDDELSWRKHIDQLSTEISKITGITIQTQTTI